MLLGSAVCPDTVPCVCDLPALFCLVYPWNRVCAQHMLCLVYCLDAGQASQVCAAILSTSDQDLDQQWATLSPVQSQSL